MLSVKLLPSNSEILKLEYLQVEEANDVLVVCPSPQKADGIRSHLQNINQSTDVITISKFSYVYVYLWLRTATSRIVACLLYQMLYEADKYLY